MDPFNTLPLECLQQIVRILVYTNDVSALTALLRVNKYSATVTLPFLYTAPFRDSFHARLLPGGKTTNLAVSHRLMARVLLSRALASAQGAHVDEPAARLLCIVFDINMTPSNNSVRNREVNKVSSLDYLAHIRQLDRKSLFPGLYGPFATLDSDLTAFIRGNDFFTLAQLDLLPPTYRDAFPDQRKLCRYSLSTVVNRIVHWTIAFPILEQLQVIVLPISDIGRYLDNVERLGSLRRVIVSMDKVFGYERQRAVDGEDLDRVQVWEALAVCKQDAMDKLVRFFREHTRIFSGCLQEVEYRPGDMGDVFFQECPEKVKIQVIGLLPPLLRPSALNMGNWHRFFAHPEEIDLSCVENVETGAPHGRVFDLIRGRKEFLRQCRALRRLNMACLGEGTFRWAVKEKQELERLQGNITNFYHPTDKKEAGATITEQATSRPLYLQHGLVPLVQVSISDVSSTTDELDDIVFAFSHTLERLIVSLRIEESAISYFGHNWTVDLPALTRLTITTWNRLKINRHLLARCPNLVSVEIFDNNASRYQCREIVPCAPAQLKKLGMINLLGWCSLTFHPDTLYSTERLVSLTISVPYALSIYCYIPPVEELDRSYGILQDDGDLGTEATTGTSAEAIDTPEAAIARPAWRWDWHLPYLMKLELSGEYAFRFQFRMLQGCPSLKTLDLNMHTESLTHIVVLTVADFFMPQQDNSDFSSTPPATTTTPPPPLPKRERIVAPNLQMLTMRGSWSIDDAVMAQFLSRTTFPRLKHVTANAWIGFSWVGLTNALRARATSDTTSASSMPSTATAPSSSPSTTPTMTTAGRDTLKTIVFERENPTPEELRDAGIVDIDCVGMQQLWRREDCLAVGVRLQYLYNVLRELDGDR